MSPRSSDQFKSIRKEKRQLILESALLVFAKKGYHAASIANIASEAGISKGLLYNYFPSKEEVLKETLLEGMQHIFKPFQFDPASFSPEQFSKLFELTFSFLEEDFSHWKIYFSLLMQSEVMDLVSESLLQLLIPVLENFAIVLAKMGYKNPIEEARFLGAVLDGLTINYISDPINFPKEYCVNRLKSIYNLPI